MAVLAYLLQTLLSQFFSSEVSKIVIESKAGVAVDSIEIQIWHDVSIQVWTGSSYRELTDEELSYLEIPLVCFGTGSFELLREITLVTMALTAKSAQEEKAALFGLASELDMRQAVPYPVHFCNYEDGAPAKKIIPCPLYF